MFSAEAASGRGLRRAWLVLARFGLGLAVAAGVSWLGRQVPARGSLAALDASAAAQVANGLLLGPLGWLGGLIGEGAVAFWGRALTPLRLLSVLVNGVPGAVAMLLWGRSRRLSYGVADLRSYLALAALALGGGVFCGTVATRLAFGSMQWTAALLWSAGSAVATLLLGSLMLVVGEAALGSLLAPPLARRRGEVESATRVLAWQVALGLALTFALALLVAVVGRRLPAAEGWLHLLFVLPVLWAAEAGGLRAGVVAASLVALSFLAVRTLVPRAGLPLDAHLEAVGVLPGLVLFSFLGALRGASRDRERRLTDSLAEANAQLREDLEQAVQALSTALEAKDAYTEEHVSRVSEYALAVGARLGLAGEELVALRWASQLHDVGKIGVPEQILNKPGPLDPAEQALIAHHPSIGARILANIPRMAAAAPIVLHHQERWDGRRDGPYPGYPAGLAAEAIPLGARIVAVVDTFDAMTTDRPYRKARSHAEAIGELTRERGRQFDPRVVDVFLELVVERPWA